MPIAITNPTLQRYLNNSYELRTTSPEMPDLRDEKEYQEDDLLTFSEQLLSPFSSSKNISRAPNKVAQRGRESFGELLPFNFCKLLHLNFHLKV